MRQAIAFVLWTWLAIALCVYAYRIWRRVAKGPKSVRDQAATESGAGTATRTYDPGLARPNLDPSLDPNLDPSPTPSPVPTPLPTPDPEPPPGDTTPSAGARAGLFAAASARSGAPEPVPATPPARPTVAAALAGIEMPCGLAPLVGSGGGLDPYRVAFFTDVAPPATVGANLGDELERLGYTLRSTSEVEVLAERDGAQVRVVLHPDAAGEHIGDARRYPTVPGGSVVVEFFT